MGKLLELICANPSGLFKTIIPGLNYSTGFVTFVPACEKKIGIKIESPQNDLPFRAAFCNVL